MTIKQLMAGTLLTIIFANPCFAETKTSDSALGLGYQPLVIYKEAMNYLLGRNGKPKSAEKAAALFKSLAEKNWSSAQHMLGNLYFKGKGVEKNDLLAYKWLSIASRNNTQLAAAIYDKRKQLQNKLSSSHLEQVEAWIADWQPTMPN